MSMRFDSHPKRSKTALFNDGLSSFPGTVSTPDGLFITARCSSSYTTSNSCVRLMNRDVRKTTSEWGGRDQLTRDDGARIEQYHSRGNIQDCSFHNSHRVKFPENSDRALAIWPSAPSASLGCRMSSDTARWGPMPRRRGIDADRNAPSAANATEPARMPRNVARR